MTVNFETLKNKSRGGALNVARTTRDYPRDASAAVSRLASHSGKERACNTHAKGRGALDPSR